MFRGAFDPDDTRQMEDTVWRWLERRGIMRNDPATWVRHAPGGLSRSVRTTRVFRDAVSGRFLAAIDQLLGSGNWRKPKDWGSLLYSFPEDPDEVWDAAGSNWHWHNSGMQNIDRLDGLFNFSFITRVQPQGGGTLIADGSHNVLKHFYREHKECLVSLNDRAIKRRFFSTHPWLRELTSPRGDSTDSIRRFMGETTDVNGLPVRIVELTGEPGDAMIGHPLLMHCPSKNCAHVPRFMRACGISSIENPASESENDDSE